MNKRPYTQLLDQTIREKGFLILAHRGVSQGNIIENTVASMAAAFAIGADAVEMDVVKSTDGDFFVFHDGCESYLFANETRNIRTLSTTEIEALTYINNIGMPTNERVTPLADFIHALPADKLMNMDRSWFYWETLLPYLDSFDIAERLLLKSPAKAAYLQILSYHRKQYPFFAICHSLEEVELALSYRDRINLVGLELIADSNESDLMQAKTLQKLKSQNLYLLINALNLGDDIKLWGDYDDDTSVLQSPDKGWGKIIEQGIDIIDTDWAYLLNNYRQQRNEN